MHNMGLRIGLQCKFILSTKPTKGQITYNYVRYNEKLSESQFKAIGSWRALDSHALGRLFSRFDTCHHMTISDISAFHLKCVMLIYQSLWAR